MKKDGAADLQKRRQEGASCACCTGSAAEEWCNRRVTCTRLFITERVHRVRNKQHPARRQPIDDSASIESGAVWGLALDLETPVATTFSNFDNRQRSIGPLIALLLDGVLQICNTCVDRCGVNQGIQLRTVH